jgi:hypothetical protein
VLNFCNYLQSVRRGPKQPYLPNPDERFLHFQLSQDKITDELLKSSPITMRAISAEENRSQNRPIEPDGCPGFRFLVPGSWGHLGSSLFLDFQRLTLDFQLLIPDRYSFSAKSSQYYRILLYSCY